QHNEAAVGLFVKLARPIVDRAHAGGAQLRILDLVDLLVGAVYQLGIDPVAIHVLAAMPRAGGAEDAGLGLLGDPGAGIAIGGAAADPGPADAAPGMVLDDPLPHAVGASDDAWLVVLKCARQSLGPQVERQMRQPAMAIGGHDAK